MASGTKATPNGSSREKPAIGPTCSTTRSRVPLLMSWPGVIPPGTTIKRVVSNLDLLPTLLEIAGLGVPDNLTIRGRSLVPLLRGQTPSWDDTLFGQYDMHHDQVARMRMIRTPEWKLVRHFEPGGQDELYHLAEDHGETHDLANSTEPKSRAERDRLARRLEGWMAQIGDRAARRRPVRRAQHLPDHASRTRSRGGILRNRRPFGTSSQTPALISTRHDG